MDEATLEITSHQVRAQLSKWEIDTDLAGAYVVTLIDRDSLEVEVRRTGSVPELSPEQIRSNLLAAAETTDTAWTCEPAGLGYPLYFGPTLLGLCVLFPGGDIHPLSRWEQEVAGLALQLGALRAIDQKEPPSLEGLASEIPERSQHADSEAARKLHWEDSKARVTVPVEEELACHLILDHLPLF